MALGNTPEALAARRYPQAGESEISERSFNLIIGGMLMWGFLLNYLMVTLAGDRIVRWVYNSNPFIFLIAYMALVFIGNGLIASPSPKMSFLGYNLIAAPIGVVVCTALVGIDPDIIRTSVLLTAIITLSFMIAATVVPGFFGGLGRVLFFSLLVSIVGELVSMLIFRSGFMYEWIYAGIFGLYIGYDWVRANTCAPTVNNAIDLSASLYLDIINLFLRVLSIVARNRKRD